MTVNGKEFQDGSTLVIIPSHWKVNLAFDQVTVTCPVCKADTVYNGKSQIFDKNQTVILTTNCGCIVDQKCELNEYPRIEKR